MLGVDLHTLLGEIDGIIISDPSTPPRIQEKHCIKLMKQGLKEGQDINQLDSEGGTLLSNALYRRFPLVSKFLIAQGIDLILDDEKGRDAFFWACRNGLYDLVKILFKNVKDINKRSDIGESALVACCYTVSKVRSIDFKEAKIVNGRLVEVNNAYLDYVKTLKFLLKNGADTSIAFHKSKQTSLFGLVGDGEYEMAKILIKAGAKVKIKDVHGTTPLEYASRNGDVSMMELLLKNGAKQTKTKKADATTKKRNT